MTIIDRRYSVAEGTAVKAPCRAATTANITLSGLQSIDGVTVVEHDRVLVKNQTTGTENGIYEASTGNWLRTKDFDGAYDIVTGTRVFITSGTANALQEYAVSTTGTITIDSTSIAFVLSASAVLVPGGSTTQVQYNHNGIFGGITGATTDGIKMTLVAPILGTPTSVTLTNATGLPLSTGVSGTLPAAQFPALTGDVATSAGALATTLATVNANVGSFGSATQAIQVTFNAKGLATAVSNVTVTPAVGSITGLGTGVGTFLATPTSANLRGALTDETGTGAAVFATSPTITTPNIVGTSTNDNAAAGSAGEYIQTASGTNNASATVTMTIAAPCVVSWTGHGFTVGAATTATKFTTTGALPTGVTSGTTYYVKAIDANTFNIATTADNALAGTFITTTGTQSGTHTADIRVSMTTGTPQNIAAMSLGAGDWEVGGQMLKGAGATTTVTYIAGNLATSSAAVDRTVGRRLSFQYGGIVLGNTEFTVFDFATTRFSLSGTTTIYLVADDSFGTSTMTCAGWLRVRRPR